MTNSEWKTLIAKEFGVSNTVAKGMLHAMYKAKEHLEVPKAAHRKSAEEEERTRMQIEEWEHQDSCDEEFMAQNWDEINIFD